jgi:hypothetical protein
MPISPTPFPSGMIDDGEIPAGKLAYFRERLKNRLHEIILLEFLQQQDAYGLTKAELGRRIGKPPERITRLLAAPGNWTLDTASDLLLGMGSELDFSVALLVDKIAPRKHPQGTDAEPPKEGKRIDTMASPPRTDLPSQMSDISGIALMTGAPR